MAVPNQQIWDPVLRLLHWLLSLVFVVNYWLLEHGEFWHRTVGYAGLFIVLCRIVWGYYGPPRARFSWQAITPRAWRLHLLHLQTRQFDADAGHNPFGFLWLYLTLTLVLALATSGFLLEEVDYFFGSDRLESLHGWFADTLFVLAMVHVVAVLLMQWWGRTALIRPMITGKRQP